MISSSLTSHRHARIGLAKPTVQHHVLHVNHVGRNECVTRTNKNETLIHLEGYPCVLSFRFRVLDAVTCQVPVSSSIGPCVRFDDTVGLPGPVSIHSSCLVGAAETWEMALFSESTQLSLAPDQSATTELGLQDSQTITRIFPVIDV